MTEGDWYLDLDGMVTGSRRPHCECGATVAGELGHYSWCPMYNEADVWE